VNIQVFLFL